VCRQRCGGAYCPSQAPAETAQPVIHVLGPRPTNRRELSAGVDVTADGRCEGSQRHGRASARVSTPGLGTKDQDPFAIAPTGQVLELLSVAAELPVVPEGAHPAAMRLLSAWQAVTKSASGSSPSTHRCIQLE